MPAHAGISFFIWPKYKFIRGFLHRQEWRHFIRFRFLQQELIRKQIALDLCLSVKTIESYCQKIMEKLDIHKYTDLFKFVIWADWLRCKTKLAPKHQYSNATLILFSSPFPFRPPLKKFFDVNYFLGRLSGFSKQKSGIPWLHKSKTIVILRKSQIKNIYTLYILNSDWVRNT